MVKLPCECNNLSEINSKDMIVNFSQKHLNIANLVIDGAVIEHVSTSKLLGIYISDDLTCKETQKRASQKLYFFILLHRSAASHEDLWN